MNIITKNEAMKPYQKSLVTKMGEIVTQEGHAEVLSNVFSQKRSTRSSYAPRQEQYYRKMMLWHNAPTSI